MKRMWYMCTLEYYSVVNNAICNIWTDLEIVILSEVSQSEKEKLYYTILYCLYVDLKRMIQVNLIYKTEKDSQTQRKN